MNPVALRCWSILSPTGLALRDRGLLGGRWRRGFAGVVRERRGGFWGGGGCGGKVEVEEEAGGGGGGQEEGEGGEAGRG